MNLLSFREWKRLREENTPDIPKQEKAKRIRWTANSQDYGPSSVVGVGFMKKTAAKAPRQ